MGIHPSRILQDRINFHGITLRNEVAKLSQVIGLNYEVWLDIQDASGLQFVLPARKEIIRNDTWHKLIEKAQIELYKYFASKDRHSLAYDDFLKAVPYGVTEDRCHKMLKQFEAEPADWLTCKNQAIAQYDRLNEDSVALCTPSSPLEEQCLQNALDGTTHKNSLYRPQDAFAGYKWYDRLPRATKIVWKINKAGLPDMEIILDDEGMLSEDSKCLDLKPYAEPDDIVCVLLEEDEILLEVGADFLIIKTDDYNDPSDIILLVVEPARPKVSLICDAIFNGMFVSSDDSDADSYDRQESRYRINVDARVHEQTFGIADAEQHRIEGYVREYVQHQCLINARYTVVIEQGLTYEPLPQTATKVRNT